MKLPIVLSVASFLPFVFSGGPIPLTFYYPPPPPPPPAPTASPTPVTYSDIEFVVSEVEQSGMYFVAEVETLPRVLQGSDTFKTTIRIKNSRTNSVKGAFVVRDPGSARVKGWYNPAEYAKENDFVVGDVLTALDYSKFGPDVPVQERVEPVSFEIVSSDKLGWDEDPRMINIGALGVSGDWYKDFNMTFHLPFMSNVLWLDAVDIGVTAYTGGKVFDLRASPNDPALRPLPFALEGEEIVLGFHDVSFRTLHGLLTHRDGGGLHLAFSRSHGYEKCESDEQDGMTLKSWYFDEAGVQSFFGCGDLCAADPECKSWMRRNSGATCYLSSDAELKKQTPGCCGDHHAFTHNSDNCVDTYFPPVPPPTSIPAAPVTSSPTIVPVVEAKPTRTPTPPVATAKPTPKPTPRPEAAPVSAKPTQTPATPPSPKPTSNPITSPPTVCECPPGKELHGDRCYDPCSTFGDNLEGAGAFCEYKCPLAYVSSFSGYCLKAETLTIPSFTDRSSCENQCSDISLTGSCAECRNKPFGSKKWYPECPWGYERSAVLPVCELCLPICPDGWGAESLYCIKPPPIDRGPGELLPCATAQLNSEWGDQQQCIQEAFESHKEEFDVEGVNERFRSFAGIESATELLSTMQRGCPAAEVPSSFLSSLRECFPSFPMISVYFGLTFDLSYGVKGVGTVAVATDLAGNQNCFLSTCGGLGLSKGANFGVAIGVMLDAGICTFGGESRGIEFDLPSAGTISVGFGMQTTSACTKAEEKKVFEFVVGGGFGGNLISATKCFTHFTDDGACPDPPECEEQTCPLG